MLFATYGIPSPYCTSINASTNDITIGNFSINNYWPNLNYVPTRYQSGNYVIARAFFIKNQTTNLPGNMEENKIYYLRRTNTNVKIYTTFQDAVNQINNVLFENSANGFLFNIFFPDICYRYLNTWKPAEPALSDVPCCPPVPDVYTECPDTATISYMGNSLPIKRNGPKVYTSPQTLIGEIKYWQGGNISAHEIITIQSPSIPVEVGQWYPIFSINIGYSQQEPTIPYLLIRFVRWSPWSGGYVDYLFTARYKGSASVNDSKVMTFEYDGDDYIANNVNPNNQFVILNILLEQLKSNGILPASIPVIFSGSTPPPSQVKVFMPDAFFQNQNKPINLGQVEETLTYDPDTLTYWGDVKTYAGIAGRIHFAIPNYYPLVSSGTKYIINSDGFNNSNWYLSWLINNSSTIGGDFSDNHLNGYTNNEFSFYESCYVELIGDPYGNLQSGYSLGFSKFRMFVAADTYNGYPTGLPQGKTWFDSRIVYNRDPIIDMFMPRKSSQMLIAFSKWGTGKFNKTNVANAFPTGSFANNFGNPDHYKKNFYVIKSVHPNAHITSLGI